MKNTSKEKVVGITNYILDKKGNPVPEPNILKWAEWYENHRDEKRVAMTTIGSKEKGYFVSTVFLGMDYSFTEGALPILWETMVFKNKQTTSKPGPFSLSPLTYHPSVEKYSSRFDSREAAVKYHNETVTKVKKLYAEKQKRAKSI